MVPSGSRETRRGKLKYSRRGENVERGVLLLGGKSLIYASEETKY